jgi:hypothetical protein
VVQLTKPGEEPDFEAFVRQVDAQAHFDAHFNRTFFQEEFESVAIFEVAGEEAAAAVTAVASGDQLRLTLLKKIEPASVVASKSDWQYL